MVNQNHSVNLMVCPLDDDGRLGTAICFPYPPDVIAVDEIVSHGKRTAFLVDLAKREIKRQRLLKSSSTANRSGSEKIILKSMMRETGFGRCGRNLKHVFSYTRSRNRVSAEASGLFGYHPR